MPYFIKTTSSDELKQIFQGYAKNVQEQYPQSQVRKRKYRFLPFVYDKKPRSAEALVNRATKTLKQSFWQGLLNFRGNKPQTDVALALRYCHEHWPYKASNRHAWRKQVTDYYHLLTKLILTDNHPEQQVQLTLENTIRALDLLIQQRQARQGQDHELNESLDNLMTRIATQALQELSPLEALQLARHLRSEDCSYNTQFHFVRQQLFCKGNNCLATEIGLEDALPEENHFQIILKFCQNLANNAYHGSALFARLSLEHITAYYALASKYLLAGTRNFTAQEKLEQVQELIDEYQKYFWKQCQLDELEMLSPNETLGRLREMLASHKNTTILLQEITKYCAFNLNQDSRFRELAITSEKALRHNLKTITSHISSLYLKLSTSPQHQNDAFKLLQQQNSTSIMAVAAANPQDGLLPLITDVYQPRAASGSTLTKQQYRDLVLSSFLGYEPSIESDNDTFSAFRTGWAHIAESYANGENGFEVDENLAAHFAFLAANSQDVLPDEKRDVLLAMARSYITVDDYESAEQVLIWCLRADNGLDEIGLESRRLLAETALRSNQPSKNKSIKAVQYARNYMLAIIQNYSNISKIYRSNTVGAARAQKPYARQACKYLKAAVENLSRVANLDTDELSSAQDIVKFLGKLKALPYGPVIMSQDDIFDFDQALSNLLENHHEEFDELLIPKSDMSDYAVNHLLRQVFGYVQLTAEQIQSKISSQKDRNDHLREANLKVEYGCRRLIYSHPNSTDRLKQVALAAGCMVAATAITIVAVKTSFIIAAALPIIKIVSLIAAGGLGTIGLQQLQQASNGNRWQMTLSSRDHHSFLNLIKDLGYDFKTHFFGNGKINLLFAEEPEFRHDEQALIPAVVVPQR